jgi:hypothetical protein
MRNQAIPLPRLETLGPSQWRTLDPFLIVTDAGCTITVPAGFLTDGASAPFRKLITSWGGHYSAPALIHDYLYDCLNRGQPCPCARTRADADRIFLQLMKRSGVALLVRLGMWIAVRIGGGIPWLKDAVVAD